MSKKEALVVRSALNQWKSQGLLDEKTAGALLNDVQVISFDWKRLAKYSLWVSLICIVTAIGALLADKALMAILETIFNAPPLVKCLGLSFLSAGIYWWGTKRKIRFPEKIFSNEGILFLGVLATAGAVFQLGKAFDTGSGHFSILLFVSFIVYGILGMYFKSNLIWLFALTSLGS